MKRSTAFIIIFLFMIGAAVAGTWYDRFQVGSGLNMSSTGVLSSTGGGGGGGGGGGDGTGVPTYATKAALVAAIAGGDIPSVAYVESVATPGVGYGTCGLTYKLAEDGAGLYGEIVAGSSVLIPQYSTSPVRACEFGVVGDANYVNAGAAFAATSAGGATLTVSGAPYVLAGMSCASVHWHSSGGLTTPVATTSAVVSGHISMAGAIPAGTYKLGCWNPLSTTTGTNNCAPAQAAIDYALGKLASTVRFPDGRYKLTNCGLNATYGVGGYSEMWLEGEQPGFNGSTAGTSFWCLDATRPCVNWQGARTSGMRRITLIGANYGFAEYAAVYAVAPSFDPYDYLDPALNVSGATPGGLQTHSPLVGACIDCYAGTAPAAPYGTVSYPSSLGSPAQYGKLLSSDVSFDNSQIFGFGIQMAVGLNSDSQGDFFCTHSMQFGMGPYGKGAFNTQSRGVCDRDGKQIGLNSVYIGTDLGMGHGEWTGEISNPSASTIYQWVHFNGTAYAGSLIIRNSYCEVCVRLGDWIGTSAWNNSLTFDGGIFHADEDGWTHQIPASYLSAANKEKVSFRGGFQIVGNTRMVTLVAAGDGVDVEISDAYLRGAWSYTGGNESVARAINYFGGVPLGAPLFSVSGNTRHAQIGVAFGSSCNAGGTLCITSQRMAEELDPATRGAMTQFTTGLRDTTGRVWRFDRPPYGTIQPGSAIYVISGGEPAWSSCDTMTMTLKAAYYNFAVDHVAPGWTMIERDSGTAWVATAVSVDGSGNAIITWLQQSSLDFQSGCVSTFAGFSSSSIATLIPSGAPVSGQVEFGTFDHTSTTVSLVSRGNGGSTSGASYGDDLASWIAVGDTLCGPLYYDSARPWPFENKCVSVTAVTPGTGGGPGSLTLSAAPDHDGRFPILPFPAR